MAPRLKAENSLGYVINRLAREYARAISRDIAAHGLQPGYLPVLFALWEEEGRSQSELATIAEIEQPTMAATLTRMERDGLILRERHPSDKRASRVLLTDRARALRTQVTKSARTINNYSVSGLTVISPDDLLHALLQLTETLRIPRADR